VTISVTFVFLFNTPFYESPESSFFHVLVVFTLSATAYTIFAVPYIAMPAEMSDDPHERTIIMAYRMSFAMAGILIGSALAPFLVAWNGGGRQGYATMSVAIGLICAISMLASFFATRTLPTVVAQAVPLSLRDLFTVLIRNRAFKILVAIYVLQLTAMGIFAAALPFFAVYVLGRNEALVGTIFLATLGSAMITMSLWTFVAKRLGKRTSYTWAAAVYTIAVFSFLFADESQSLVALLLKSTVMGLGLSGIQMLPFSMLTDIIQLDSRENGNPRAGVFTGFWTAGEKLGLAIGPVVCGVVLSLAGFLESTSEQILEQSPSTLFGIRALSAVVPGLVILVSAAMIRLYPITESDLVGGLASDISDRALPSRLHRKVFD